MKCSLEPYMSRPWRRGLLYSSSSLNSKLFFFQATQFEEEKKKKTVGVCEEGGACTKQQLRDGRFSEVFYQLPTASQTRSAGS